MSVDESPRFLKLLALVGAILLAVGAFWLTSRSPRGRDKDFAKDHPIGFPAAHSAEEAIFQLDTCLLQYALVQADDAYPEGLGPLGPDGIHCANAALASGASGLNYRFAYFPTSRDAKGNPRGFLLYAFPLFASDGQLAPESTPAEYFANEDGLMLVRKDFGTLKEHTEPFLGLPKTLQVLGSSLRSGNRLPTDQSGILNALGQEGSPGYSTVPRGYQGLWTPADNDAAVVWTNLSEGYLYSYRPEHGAAPAHFILLARPVHIGLGGVDAPIRPIRHYFLNESGSVHTTLLDRDATALDPEVSNCERVPEDCEGSWISPPSGSPASP